MDSGRNFQRALNDRPLGPEWGDPERWGGVATLKGSFPANANLDLTIESTGQLVRAQAAQLVTRQWIVLASYEVTISDPANSGKVTLTSIDLDIVWGVGQIAMGGPARIFPVPLNAASAWTGAATADAGVVEVGHVPGSYVGVLKARAKFHDAGAPQAVSMFAKVSVSIAPRAA